MSERLHQELEIITYYMMKSTRYETRETGNGTISDKREKTPIFAPIFVHVTDLQHCAIQKISPEWYHDTLRIHSGADLNSAQIGAIALEGLFLC